jgi:glycerol-3-phosphate dehydrogenase (NAD(P)+)
MTKIAILGGGSWGTALAIVFSRTYKTHDISLWVHNPALAESIGTSRENTFYLPGISVPGAIHISNHLSEVAANADILVGAIPSAHARAIYTQALPYVSPQTIFVSATKGLEPSTHLRISKVLAQVLGQTTPGESSHLIAVLSGPSFAAEAARGEPTAVVIASEHRTPSETGRDHGFALLADDLQEEFAGPAFRLYSNTDVLGVELAGAMKNVMAIAAGCCQGLGLGSNPVAALVTRGLAEMTRLAVALGARAETLSGLAGLGDLVLTCTGGLSRNRHVGIELGKGHALHQILASMRMVAEGVDTAGALLALGREHKIELPITEQVEAILHQNKSPREAIREIMERPLKREH